MKRIIAFMLVVVLALSVAGCGKSEAAKIVDDQILAIGTVTLESEAAVIAAENAYAALTEEQKAELDNYAILVSARSTLDSLIEADKQAKLQAAAAEIDNIINAIGTVTLESNEAITAARTAYDAAEQAIQAYVSQIDALVQAEKAYMGLQANEVDALIEAIGTVTLKNADAVKTAQDAYNALPADAKNMVKKASVLTEAAQTLKDLRTAEANKKLGNLRLQHDQVRGIKWYYPKAFPFYASQGYWGADVRCFALPYMGVQGNNVWLRLVCDYTADDWIFFEKITFAVDDQRYYKYFSYFDVTRDNAYGDIWEYVDIEVGQSEIELLWAIANSNTTIIRFEGDNYYDDFTVKQKDKDAIKEMLTIYEMLQG